MYNGYDDSLNDSDTEDEPSPTIRGETGKKKKKERDVLMW